MQGSTFLTQRLAALREDLAAVAVAPADVVVAVPPPASEQPLDAALWELEQYIGENRPKG